MSVITIPFGYEQLPDEERDSIVPICVLSLVCELTALIHT